MCSFQSKDRMLSSLYVVIIYLSLSSNAPLGIRSPKCNAIIRNYREFRQGIHSFVPCLASAILGSHKPMGCLCRQFLWSLSCMKRGIITFVLFATKHHEEADTGY